MIKPSILRVVTAPYCIHFHLAFTLEKMVKDFRVIVVGNGVSEFQDKYPEITWIDLDIERKPHIISDIKAAFLLWKVIRKHRPDITHSLMPKAGLITALASWLSRVPVRMHTYTGQVWATKDGVAKYALLFFDWLINQLNTICLTDSPSQSQFLLQNHISYKDKPLPVISKGSLSGVDLARFDLSIIQEKSKVLKQELGISNDLFIFVFLARKTRDKGALDILYAFSQVIKEVGAQHVKLLFVGPDESGGGVKNFLDEHPSCTPHIINIDKPVDNHELYLSISDVLCLPSYREGFGSIVIDAAALGVPAIGSNIMGLVDAIVDGETGYLFPCGDIDALVKHMVYFAKSRGEVKKMGLRSQQRVKAYFDANVIYEKQKEFYFRQLR